MHSKTKKSNRGSIHFLRFGYTRVLKMSAYIYRNSQCLQNARIWHPLAPIFFLNFLKNYLGNSKHFETNLFFGLFWPFGLHKGQKAEKRPFCTTRGLGPSRNSCTLVYTPVDSKIAFSKSQNLPWRISVLWKTYSIVTCKQWYNARNI